MVDFNDDNWEFDLTGKEEVDTEPAVEANVISVVGDAKRWEQYCDMDLYEFESKLRKWMEAMTATPGWKNDKRGWNRRFTFGMLWPYLYGRPYDSKVDGKKGNSKLAKVVAYYSSRIQKEGSIRGKHYTKKIYTLSPRRAKRNPPYSLRLRLEYFRENGIIPTRRNMALPKDNLEEGHARNPRTDANMERRREKMRKIYNERYADRKH